MKRRLPPITPCPELLNVNKTMIIEVPKEFRKDNEPKFRIVSSFSFLEDHSVNFKADKILKLIMEKGTAGRKLECIGTGKQEYSSQSPQNFDPEEQSANSEVSYKQESAKTAEPHCKLFGDESSPNQTMQFKHLNSSLVPTTKHATNRFQLPSGDEPVTPKFHLVKQNRESVPQQQENTDLNPFIKSEYDNELSKETSSSFEPVKEIRVDKNCWFGDQVMDRGYGFLPDDPGTGSELAACYQMVAQEKNNYMSVPNVNDEDYKSYHLNYEYQDRNSRPYLKRRSRRFHDRHNVKRMSSNHNFGQRPKMFSGSPQQHSQFQDSYWYGGNSYYDSNSEANEHVSQSDCSSSNAPYRVPRRGMQRIPNSSNWQSGQNAGNNIANQNDRFPQQEGQKPWLPLHLQRPRSNASRQQPFTQGAQGNLKSASDLPEHVFWTNPDLSSAKRIVFLDIKSYANFFSDFVRILPPELHIWTFMTHNFKLKFPDSATNNKLLHSQLLHITLGDINKTFPNMVDSLHHSLLPSVAFIIITNMQFNILESIAEHRTVNVLSPSQNQRMHDLYRILSL